MLLIYFCHRNVAISAGLIGFTGAILGAFSTSSDMMITCYGILGDPEYTTTTDCGSTEQGITNQAFWNSESSLDVKVICLVISSSNRLPIPPRLHAIVPLGTIRNSRLDVHIRHLADHRTALHRFHC
ncbi:Hypothetical predicted protein [Octopus vulgaris]|uniref:Uncharacterized protein n=1 Tax=Octopus vulgaris TaxID=6645 RepID=A0AA36BN61_OCTVU|nr:Hypothetical predicted protein [Octopus vulgaris]